MHWGFQDSPAIYSALKMTNDSFKFYLHILVLPLKFETTVIIQVLRILKCESKI